MENKDLPAFPIKTISEYDNVGLSKREYIAAMALQGILANSFLIDNNAIPSIDYAVKMAVSVTDELLKQLESK